MCKTGAELPVKDDAEHTTFDFLGFQFRPRRSRNSKTGQMFNGFNPAISPKALKTIRNTIRSWQLSKRTPMSLQEIQTGSIQWYEDGLIITDLTVNLS